MFENVKYNEVKVLSKILKKWIRHCTNNNNLHINEDCLNWESLILIEIHNNWEMINKNFSDSTRSENDLITLLWANSFFKETNYLKKFPKKRFLISSKTLRNNISSIRATFNFFKILFKKKDIIINKTLGNFLSKKTFFFQGDIIFSKFITFLYKKSARKKLKNFLKNEKLNYDINVLIEIIPDYLVELLPIYTFLSKFYEVENIRGWVMDIYSCPILLIKCILSKKIKIVGYQHGGSYGFYKHILKKCEYDFYDKFIFWGFNSDDILPFKFFNDNFDSIYGKSYRLNKLDISKINLINDRQDVFYGVKNKNINLICKKIRSEISEINLIIHPYDYEYSINKFSKIKKIIKIYNGEANFSLENNGIYLCSLFSTIFWKLIYLKKTILCFYPSNFPPEIEHNLNLVESLYSNNLIFSDKDLIKFLGYEFLEETLTNNYNFYRGFDVFESKGLIPRNS